VLEGRAWLRYPGQARPAAFLGSWRCAGIRATSWPPSRAHRRRMPVLFAGGRIWRHGTLAACSARPRSTRSPRTGSSPSALRCPPACCACQEEIWSDLGDQGVRRDDPSTWREPVVRISCPESEAFAAAGTQPILWEAFDQLIGEGRWWRRRGVGGSIPVRFPSQADPGDAGWHIEAGFEVGGDWWVNYRSRGRGLLTLYLFS